MVMKYGWLIITFMIMQHIYAMDKSQEIKGEFRDNQFLRPVDANDLPKLIGKIIMYQETTYKKGILGEQLSNDYYRIYFDEKDKSKATIRSATELYYFENYK